MASSDSGASKALPQEAFFFKLLYCNCWCSIVASCPASQCGTGLSRATSGRPTGSKIQHLNLKPKTLERNCQTITSKCLLRAVTFDPTHTLLQYLAVAGGCCAEFDSLVARFNAIWQGSALKACIFVFTHDEYRFTSEHVHFGLLSQIAAQRRPSHRQAATSTA